jgi:hypothetical protein
MWRFPILALAASLALCGCYSEHWREAEILVTTMPPGADCTLARHGEKIAEVTPTPGIALIRRSGEDVAIACRRSGYREALAVSHALGDAVGVETLTEGRSGYDYESPVNITLTPAPEAASR